MKPSLDGNQTYGMSENGVKRCGYGLRVVINWAAMCKKGNGWVLMNRVKASGSTGQTKSQ